MQKIEERLKEEGSFFDSGIEKYISYACEGSGKRFRPLVALFSGGATGRVTDGHLNLALIVELIHIASLVHDDIMDGALLRRDRPTLHAKWGSNLTVLAGDILFAHALKLATDFSKTEICRRIADAAIGVCSGEMLQTEHRFDVDLNLESYYRIVEMKTGSLFAVACELGAFLNEVDNKMVEALKEYGNMLGIAYQLLDDCIDLLGDETSTGKTLGTDLVGGKWTLPILLFLKKASAPEAENLRHALITQKAIHRSRLVQSLVDQGIFSEAQIYIHNFLHRGEMALKFFPKNDYVEGLRSIIFYIRGMTEKKLSF